jgi:hypothetical protein
MTFDGYNVGYIPYRQNAPRGGADFEAAAERILISKSWERREEIRLLIRFSCNGSFQPLHPPLESFNGFRCTDDPERNLVADDRLQRPVTYQSHARIGVLPAIAKFEIRLVKE